APSGAAAAGWRRRGPPAPPRRTGHPRRAFRDLLPACRLPTEGVIILWGASHARLEACSDLRMIPRHGGCGPDLPQGCCALRCSAAIPVTRDSPPLTRRTAP